MDKETLSNYGWIVILVLILAVMLALATPFGNFIAQGIQSITAGLFSTNQNALGAGGIIIPGQEMDDPNEEELPGVHNGIIPEGAVYYVGVVSSGQAIKSTFETERKYTAGDEFPDEFQPGDAYVYGDYVYAYKYCVEQFNYNLYWGTYSISEASGWGVGVYDTSKSSYGEILSYINGIPVTDMPYTFYVNHSVVNGPTIPATVINTGGIFASLNSDTIGFYDRCMKLENVRFAEGITKLDGSICSEQRNLKEVHLPSTLTEFGNFAFRNCDSLTDIYFGGTKSQWANVTKGENWNQNTGAYTIHCSDGDITCKNHSLVFANDATWQPALEYQHKKVGTCSLCGENEYTYAYHNFVLDNSVDWEYEEGAWGHKKPATCKDCGQTKYEYASHSYTDKEGAEYTYYDANRHTIMGVCSCGYEELRYVSHTGGTATCQSKKTCTGCNQEYGSLGTCSGGTATCQEKAKCSTCGNEYGTFGPHNISNGVCTLCGSNITVIESEHSPYSNNISSVTLGSWDYSDAQSVTITITYQTESTSWDWIYLKSGNNYIDLNGNITSTATKIGGTTKTTKTFTTTATSGSVIFKTDGSGNNYYGVHVTVTPNY